MSGMEDLLLYVGSSEDERQFSLHVLEIISLMFREQTPEQIASAGGPRSTTERQADEKYDIVFSIFFTACTPVWLKINIYCKP